MLIVFVRAIILYAVVVFSIRLMGKRQLGELQPSELVITILVSNIATLPIENISLPMLTGVIPILTLVCLDVIMSSCTMKSRKLRRIVSGSPKIIINDGVIDQLQLKKLRYTVDDVMESLRGQGIFDISEVQFAVIETTGTVSVYQKPDMQPVTSKTIKNRPENSNPPQIIIDDGDIILRSLEFLELPESWLYSVLSKEGLTAHEVFVMTADDKGKYKIIKKNGGQ